MLQLLLQTHVSVEARSSGVFSSLSWASRVKVVEESVKSPSFSSLAVASTCQPAGILPTTLFPMVGAYTQLVGVDSPNNDIQCFRSTGQANCLATCDATSGCVAAGFTALVDNSPNECCMKSAFSTLDHVTPVGWSLFVKQNFIGLSGAVGANSISLGSFVAADARDCLIKCAGTATCIAFNFDNSTQSSCQLLSKVNMIASSTTSGSLYLSTFTPPSTQTVGAYTQLVGIDSPNNDIQCITSTGQANCLASCDAASGCVAAGFSAQQNNECCLKKAFSTPDHNVPAGWSLFVKQTFTGLSGAEGFGTDLGCSSATDSEVCIINCAANSSCVGFSFDSQAQTCCLKSSVTALTASTASTTISFYYKTASAPSTFNIGIYNPTKQYPTVGAYTQLVGVDTPGHGCCATSSGQAECLSRCDSDSTCVSAGFTTQQNNMCCQKFAFGTTTSDSDPLNPWSLFVKQTFTALSGATGLGTDLGCSSASNAKVCIVNCAATPSCVGFNFDSSTQTSNCCLKSSVTSLASFVANNATATSSFFYTPASGLCGRA